MRQQLSLFWTWTKVYIRVSRLHIVGAATCSVLALTAYHCLGVWYSAILALVSLLHFWLAMVRYDEYWRLRRLVENSSVIGWKLNRDVTIRGVVNNLLKYVLIGSLCEERQLDEAYFGAPLVHHELYPYFKQMARSPGRMRVCTLVTTDASRLNGVGKLVICSPDLIISTADIRHEQRRLLTVIVAVLTPARLDNVGAVRWWQPLLGDALCRKRPDISAR